MNVICGTGTCVYGTKAALSAQQCAHGLKQNFKPGGEVQVALAPLVNKGADTCELAMIDPVQRYKLASATC